MGADIYLKSITEPARKHHQPLFDAAVQRRQEAARRYGPRSPQADAAQEEVEKHWDDMFPGSGYFRDSYNGTSLFQMLGLSWWQLGGEVLTNRQELRLKHAATLIKLHEDHRQNFDAFFAAWVDRNKNNPEGRLGVVFDDGENSEEAWKAYFSEKLDRWIALLRLSVEKKEKLYWSI